MSYVLYSYSYVLCFMFYVMSYVLYLMSYVLCFTSSVLCNTSWAFCPACIFVFLDASCLMRVNLSCIQDTSDTRFMQPCIQETPNLSTDADRSTNSILFFDFLWPSPFYPFFCPPFSPLFFVLAAPLLRLPRCPPPPPMTLLVSLLC